MWSNSGGEQYGGGRSHQHGAHPQHPQQQPYQPPYHPQQQQQQQQQHAQSGSRSHPQAAAAAASAASGASAGARGGNSRDGQRVAPVHVNVGANVGGCGNQGMMSGSSSSSAQQGGNHGSRKASIKPIEPGTQVIGGYYIGKTIGKGSFGKVKLGTHIATGEKVAIKTLNRLMLKHAKMDKKISREIKILKLFSHPNICRLYEVITTSTEIYLIMEYVDGGELYDYIVNTRNLTEDTARYILQQIVCAIEYCHHFRVVHRDLKPENILLGPNLQVKLIDFGLSNLMSDGEFLATSCGSPNYAAPEVISGKLYFGPEVDVWSCGVIMYALLFGRLPFDEDTIPLLFAMIKKGKYTIPDEVSPSGRALLEQMLVVDPLVRLTIPQIRDNSWFNTNLPTHLTYSDANFLSQESRISSALVSRTCKILNAREKEVRQSIESGNGPACVAYNILLDVERRAQIASEARKMGIDLSEDQSGTHTAPFQPNATERELNLGLLLSQNPAMEVLLDKGDASSNKSAYNTGTFVPASAQSLRNVLEGTPLSTGTFSISKSSTRHTLMDGSGGGRSFTANSLIAGGMSLRGQRGPGADGRSNLNASFTDTARIGSVAKSKLMYTTEEENFLIENNYGWRVGLMTDMTAETALSVLYEELKGVEMEWKVVSPFRVRARTTEVTWDLMKSKSGQDKGNASSSSPKETAADGSLDSLPDPQRELPPQVMLSIFLFRIHEKHDKGYLVDFCISRGNTLAGMDLVMYLSDALIKRIG